MGEVFLADDTQLGRKVAIKFLTEALEADETARERLHREARSAAALDHPYVCKIYELAEIDGRTGIVMEHVTGETVQARLRRAPLSPKEALEIAGEIAEALDEAHQHRVVHRDLKPSNVMLTKQGHVKVMDFGLAKQAPSSQADAETVGALTESGVRIGTPGYMSPEQLLGGQVDERSDIFAFGILLYELLANVHPFTRASQSGTMSAILRETPAPVSQYAKDAPETARVTLDRLLAKEPQHRYQSFRDVREDLRQLLQDASGLTPVPQTAPAEAGASTGRTPFVGRESERAEARRLLDHAVSGHGEVLLLGGEPGVGKTRLAEEVLAEGLQRGCLALTGRCYETEGTPPFIPWVEIVERSASIVPNAAFREALGDAAPEIAKLVPELRQIFSDIPQPIELPPEQQRRYLFNNFVSFVKRGTRVTPQVLLIDDLHWADDSTLLLLQHVAQHASEMPMLIVGTYRDVDLDVARPFAKMLEAFTRQRLAHKVALARLPQTGVGEMLEALSGQTPPAHLVTAIYAETEGNPFFVEEVFQHLSEEGRLFDAEGRWRADLPVEDLDVPEGIRLVIGRRVERLSPEARQVLTTAAVVGRSFDLTLLDALGDAAGDALLTALEEADAAKLIQTVASGRDVRWEFAHGLIRQTLESSLSLPRRQRAHLRVAEAMERVYVGQVDRHASDIGQHLYQAGVAADPEKTVRFLGVAGDQALGAGGFEGALSHFDRALSLDPVAQDVRARLLVGRGAARRGLGEWDEAIAEWTQALKLFESAADPASAATTCLEIGFAQMWKMRPSESESFTRRGLEALSVEPSPLRCRLLAQHAWSLSLLRQLDSASAALSDALEGAEAIGNKRLEGVVRVTGHYVHHHNLQSTEGHRSAERAMECLRGDRDQLLVTEARLYLHYMLLRTGRLEGLQAFEEEIGGLFERQGRLDLNIMEAFLRARRWLTTGLPDDYEAFGREFLKYATKMGAWQHIPLAWMAQAKIWRGELEDARRQAVAAVEVEPLAQIETGHAWSALFLCDAYLGRRAPALELLEARKGELPQAGALAGIGSWTALLKVIEGLALLGEAAQADELYPVALDAIETGTLIPRDANHLVTTLAAIAAACGRQWHQAEAHFQTALQQAHEIPFRSEQPEVRRWYAQMLIDRNALGDRDKAGILLGEAVEMYRTIGMPKHLEIAQGMSEKL